MTSFAKHVGRYLLYLLIILFGVLFFYRLSVPTLVSWDEAWYASIAREVLHGNIFYLVWNGKPFYDHPPLGFWFMALSFLIFGINEFAARFPSALFGVLTIITTYQTARLLFKEKVIHYLIPIVLGTCVWYVLRVRSGNLDSQYIFFYILTIYGAVRTNKNVKWIIPTMMSFAALMLTKSLGGIFASLFILYYLLPHLKNIKQNAKWLLYGLGVFLLIALPWYVLQTMRYPEFLRVHFFNIGMRQRTLWQYLHLDVGNTFFYLHMGVRKWYYLWFVGLVGVILAALFRKDKRNYFFLLLWNAVILYPFLTTTETQIWHLIPVYLPLSFVTVVGIYEIIWRIARVVRIKEILINSMVVLMVLAVMYLQIKTFYPEVIPGTRYISDDVAISKKAGEYNKPIFIDDDFYPLATFYSGKNVTWMLLLPDAERSLTGIFKSPKKHFVVITRKWATNNLKTEGIPYHTLFENSSYAIVEKTK